MNNDFPLKKVLENKLQTRLSALRDIWTDPRNNAGVKDVDAAIKDVEYAAQINFMGSTLFRLSLLDSGGSTFNDDYKKFFEAFQTESYSPRFYGTNLSEGSTPYKQALYALKSLAADVGAEVIRDQESLAARQAADAISMEKTKPWLASGIIPTEHGIQGIETTELDFSDWAAQTVPAELFANDGPKPKPTLKDEIDTMETVVRNGSAADVKAYLKNTLRPRYAEMHRELESRKQKYTRDNQFNAIGFQLSEGPLLDFQQSLRNIMLDALNKKDPKPAVAAQAEMTPYPSLILDEETPVSKMTAAQQKSYDAANAKLKVMASSFEGLIQRSSADALIKIYQTELKPRIAVLHKEIINLKAAGNNDVLLEIKEKHYNVLKSGSTDIFAKIDAEKANELAVARDVARVAAIAEATTTTAQRRPASDFAFIPTLTEVVPPKHHAAAASVAFQPPSRKDDWAKAAATEAIAKAAAKATTKAAAPAVEISAPANDSGVERVVAEEVVVARRPSTTPQKVQTVKFKDVPSAATTMSASVTAPAEKASLLSRAKAIAKQALVMTAVVGGFVGAVYAGLVVGEYNKESNRKADAATKATISAKAEFNNQAQQPDVWVPTTNAFTSIVPPDAPSAKTATPVVDRSLAEEEAFQAAQASKLAKQAKVKTSAKTSFAPAANDTADYKAVEYTNVIEAKPFDIATARFDLSTLAKACAQAGNASPNGVCADFVPQVK